MLRNTHTGLRVALTAAAMVGVTVTAACGGENLFSVPAGTGGSDLQAPAVTITSPQGDSPSAPIGDSLFVSAQVSDNVGVVSLRMYGIALRGDADLGTDEVVQRFAEKTVTLQTATRDTTIMRYLQPTSDATNETAMIVVEAADDVGNVGADTLGLVLSGPALVEIHKGVDGHSIRSGLGVGTGSPARD